MRNVGSRGERTATGTSAVTRPGRAPITRIRVEAFYINQLLPRIVDDQDSRLRNDFLTNSGLDRFQVEELEREYFEMRAFPAELLEAIR